MTRGLGHGVGSATADLAISFAGLATASRTAPADLATADLATPPDLATGLPELATDIPDTGDLAICPEYEAGHRPNVPAGLGHGLADLATPAADATADLATKAGDVSSYMVGSEVRTLVC